MDEVKKIYNIGDVTSIINSSGDSSNPIELSISPSTEEQIYSPQENEYYSRVTVHAVTSDIDPSIIPENIRDGTTILGVNGTLSVGSIIDDISSNLISGVLEELDTTNLNITELRSGLFLTDTRLKRLVVGPSIDHIGEKLFGAPFVDNGSVLESLEFSTDIDGNNNLLTIKDYAFYGCKKLTSVVFPNHLKVIDFSAFKGCINLSNIDLPSSLQSIGKESFYGCEKLTRVVFPDNLSSIGNGAFRECTSLSAIFLPSSLHSIGNQAFYGCPLTVVNYAGSKENFGLIEFGTNWFSNDTNELTVHCSNGDYVASLV